MTIVIDHEAYGARQEFSSLAEAEDAIRDCGPEFANVSLMHYGNANIFDERGRCVGREERSGDE